MFFRYKLTLFICKFLPPLVAQSIRNKIISIEHGEKLNLNFIKKSFTGSKFYGNTADFHAFIFSIHGYFDWRNVIVAKTTLNFKKGDIVEVGANIGTETISYSDVAKTNGQKVYAFEPVLSNLELLYKNKTENSLDNLHISDKLVSDYIGLAKFKIPVGNNSGSGHITHAKDHHKIQEFEVTTLDNCLSDKVLSFISIDVEGHEYQVLKGCDHLIKLNKPVIILEVNSNYLKQRGKTEVKELYSLLKSHNYDCYQIMRLGLKKINPEVLKKSSNKNWVCVNKMDLGLAQKINNKILINGFNPCL